MMQETNISMVTSYNPNNPETTHAIAEDNS